MSEEQDEHVPDFFEIEPIKLDDQRSDFWIKYNDLLYACRLAEVAYNKRISTLMRILHSQLNRAADFDDRIRALESKESGKP